MGLFEKFKNMFTEEVEDTEPIKKEMLQVEIPSPKKEDVEALKEESPAEEPAIKIEKKPTLFFDDEDFKALEPEPVEETRTSRTNYENVERISKPLYGGYDHYKKEEPKKEEKKVFKPTPIISPIYGILDKNYEKDDIIEKKPTKAVDYLSTPESPIDTIRKKAYGTLEDDLESTLFGKNSILFDEKKEEPEEIDLFEEFDDVHPVVKELEEKNIPIKKYREKREVEIEVADSKKPELEEVEKIDDDFGPSILTDDLEETPKDDLKETSKAEEDNSDLFNLIDSMYESEDE